MICYVMFTKMDCVLGVCQELSDLFIEMMDWFSQSNGFLLCTGVAVTLYMRSS